MKRLGYAFFGIAFSGLGLLFFWMWMQDEANEAGPESQVIITGKKETHRVTPAMLESSNKMASQAAPGFDSQATDDRSYRLEALIQEGPILLAFIKDGCPCSTAAQPYFNRLHDAYGTSLKFFGVFDGSVSKAKAWAAENKVRFPILADPELKIVRAYKAENSAYVALVSKGGTIEKLWPGYSSEMLKDVSLRLARLADTDPKPIDTTDSPDEMLSGCPFDL
ncbi:peroxiredoxin family protein [Singulisphaera sp. PoT]|uniref:peroxiredoxin family protein n=1 Tax=Singulisphaera sp. PoT TaxID=3411797 RepID=UPI003BF4C435